MPIYISFLIFYVLKIEKNGHYFATFKSREKKTAADLESSNYLSFYAKTKTFINT
jgi:hypothetical protein